MDWGQVQSWLIEAAEAIWRVLSSAPAQRIYVLAIFGAILIQSFRMALARKGSLLAELEDNPYEYTARGRAPTTDKGKAKRRNDIAAHRKRLTAKIARSTGEMLFLGVLVPTMLFALGTIFYPWFDASATPLVEASTLRPVPAVSGWQLGTYLADHLLRGGLFDLMEVFRLHSTTVTNNVAAYPYSIGVFVYHLYVEVFLIFAFAVISKAVFLLVRAIREPDAEHAAEI